MFNSIFWVPISSHPKAATEVKNSLYYGKLKDMELSPSSPNYLKDSWKLLLLLISINWPTKFGDLMSSESKDIFKNATHLMY